MEKIVLKTLLKGLCLALTAELIFLNFVAASHAVRVLHPDMEYTVIGSNHVLTATSVLKDTLLGYIVVTSKIDQQRFPSLKKGDRFVATRLITPKTIMPEQYIVMQ
ncbi:MAG: hypothetical protein HYV67_04025 [Candidatus Taylorbacteria bacterium]|nr:hypothetical protein [Candidatus Taylorbacteria bacterium]